MQEKTKEINEARVRPVVYVSTENVAESDIARILEETKSRQITFREILFYPEILGESKSCCAWVAPEWTVPHSGDYEIVLKADGKGTIEDLDINKVSHEDACKLPEGRHLRVAGSADLDKSHLFIHKCAYGFELGSSYYNSKEQRSSLLIVVPLTKEEPGILGKGWVRAMDALAEAKR
jgi:hypothetical protein